MATHQSSRLRLVEHPAIRDLLNQIPYPWLPDTCSTLIYPPIVRVLQKSHTDDISLHSAIHSKKIVSTPKHPYIAISPQRFYEDGASCKRSLQLTAIYHSDSGEHFTKVPHIRTQLSSHLATSAIRVNSNVSPEVLRRVLSS